MKILASIGALLLTLLIAACATGPSLKERAAALPAVDQGKARIFFYRTQVVGAAYQPDVLLNGEKVGTAAPRGVFFRDVAPGKYSVTTTMTKEVVNLDVAAGEKRYVKLGYSFGFNIYPELVPAAQGETESSELSYIAPVGADRDAHGCIGSAGYSWCQRTRQCERPWELAAKEGFARDADAFSKYCNAPAR